MEPCNLATHCQPALRRVGWGLCACWLLPALTLAQPVPAGLAANTTPTSVRPVTTPSEGVGGRPAAVLTVTDLTAATTAQGVLLTWAAPAGKVPARLEVERSTDGTTFRPVGTVGPAEAATYRFLDAHPATPPVYYRLRQPGGPVSAVLTYAATDNAWQPSPNPAADWLSCGPGPASGDYRIQDAAGRTVLSGHLAAGQRIDVRRLRNGHYTLELRNGAMRASHSFVKFAVAEQP